MRRLQYELHRFPLTLKHVFGLIDDAYFKRERLSLKLRYLGDALDFETRWRTLNPENSTHVEHEFDFSRVKVGAFTYGTIDPEINNEGPETLTIGRFCSIARGVRFLLAAEHPYRGLSTFPFKVMVRGDSSEALSKGPIVIGDDVWIGLNAIICSGVHIGQGAIVAAGSVVTHDVDPYAIVGGNPARVIKYRFDADIRKKLSTFDWSCIAVERLSKLVDLFYNELSATNVDAVLTRLREFELDERVPNG